MKKILLLPLFFILIGINIKAQTTGKISGKVLDASTREPIPFVNIVVSGTQIGASSDINGEFVIENAPLGYNKLEASFIGYQSMATEDFLVSLGKSPNIVIEMKAVSQQLEAVEIKADLFQKRDDAPVSMQTIGIAEIEKNPGGNRDISKVIQSLPGVAANPGFRNDIIIRGGSPSENRFFLDGVEVPVINHFQTQGSSGGPVGIINANLIREVDLYSSSFPVSRGNSLSSVLDFKQIDGNKEKIHSRFTIGSSDIGLTIDGPIGKKTTYVLSVRQSYLQFLFTALKLPFLPTFNDFQLKVKHQINDKNFISVIGLGALDRFKLNEKVNNGVTDEDQLKYNEYLLSNLPIQEQWNYTFGVVYDKYAKKDNKHKIVVSRNQWKNTSFKYFNNDDSSPNNLLLNYSSTETENKFRYEWNKKLGLNNFSGGFGIQDVYYTNTTYKKIYLPSGTSSINFSSDLTFIKYAAFGQYSRRLLSSKMIFSAGLRIDGNTYSSIMLNPLNQLSPRLAISYSLTDKLSINANVGRYNQLPAYTILGYTDAEGTLVNKENDVKYISANHYVAGIQYNPDNSSKITVEGFYKQYSNYPFSINDSICLANLGSDFGVIGNEAVKSNSKGRAYGIEFLAQKRSYKGLYGIFAYTFVRSEFKNARDEYIPSSWDNRHMLTFTGGIKLKKNWQVGSKFRIIGGRPYTPYDYNTSSLIANYDIVNAGVLDYSQINSLRYPWYNQLDLRVDKTWYREKISYNLYLDIQNIYGKKSMEQPILLAQTDNNGNRLIDPNDGSRYLMKEIKNESGTVLPTIGLIIDF